MNDGDPRQARLLGGVDSFSHALRTARSRELTDSSLPKIGKEFEGRDRTTVIHATSKVTRPIREDRSVYNLVQELTARINQAR